MNKKQLNELWIAYERFAAERKLFNSYLSKLTFAEQEAFKILVGGPRALVMAELAGGLTPQVKKAFTYLEAYSRPKKKT